jgi:predicted nucleotidyltransferase component of viral defense system
MEYIVAEKLETLYDRGSANSRAKDIYDLVYLYPRCLDKQKTMDAIQRTFQNRGTALPASFVGEAEGFDQTILKAAWPGIRVLDDKLEFDDLWAALMKYLRELDEY